MNESIHSDLAIESKISANTTLKESPENPEYEERVCGSSTICRLNISSPSLAKKYGRREGSYVTVICGKIWLFSDADFHAVSNIIGDELKKMILSLIKADRIKKNLNVLVVGLGNSEITPDAIGPATVSRLIITRHINEFSKDIFNSLGQCAVSAITPGVLAQTGIDTLELVKGAVENTRPNVVIAVDALASRSCERLAATVQIANNGISPGSGIGNLQKAINEENIGVPVIALGVPTVVDSATLVYDALENAGITDIDNNLKTVLDNKRSFFVSPKECDVITESVGKLLSGSINYALSVST